MKKMISKGIAKLYIQHWIIGITRGNMQQVIRNKSFNPDITWIPLKSMREIYADPFLLKTSEGRYDILFETYSVKEKYGKIAIMSIDENLKPINPTVVLDTKSHLSYPFIFLENGKTYVFPESARSGSLACYEYNPRDKSLHFLQTVINEPLLDASILKYNNKYWVFGIIRGTAGIDEYKLCIYFSDSLLGPYTAHAKNPVANSLNGTRSAGNFIEVDGVIYRPTQNCKRVYGESITINKINLLNETDFIEEFYMSIMIDQKSKKNSRIDRIHTINGIDNIIVVDGKKGRFSPGTLLKEIAGKLRVYLKRLGKAKVISHLLLIDITVEIIHLFFRGRLSHVPEMFNLQNNTVSAIFYLA